MKPCPTHPSVIKSTALCHRINAHNILQDHTHQHPQSIKLRAIDHPPQTDILRTGTRAPKCHHKRSTRSQQIRAHSSHLNNGYRPQLTRIAKRSKAYSQQIHLPRVRDTTRNLHQATHTTPRTGLKDQQYSRIAPKRIHTPQTRHHTKKPHSHSNK